MPQIMPLLTLTLVWHCMKNPRPGPRGAPFIKNQKPCASAHTLKPPCIQVFICIIKPYMYNFNDRNRSDNMYMWKKLHSYFVINISIQIYSWIITTPYHIYIYPKALALISKVVEDFCHLLDLTHKHLSSQYMS